MKIGFANERPYGYENEAGATVDTTKVVFKELSIGRWLMGISLI